MGLVRASMNGNGATTSAKLTLHWSGVGKMYQHFYLGIISPQLINCYF